MSHLHFPDGLLPLWLLAAGFVISGVLLMNCLRRLKQDTDFVKKVSLLAILAAVMLVTMSIPLGGLHYHINLTVLVGLLVGPWLAFIGVFVVNFFLSFIGHGGITVVGLNTLVVGSEVFLGFYIFYGLRRYMKAIPAVFSATIAALLIGSMFMVLITSAAGFSPQTLNHSHCDHDHAHDEHEDHVHADHAHDEHGEHAHDDHAHGYTFNLWDYLEAYGKFILPLLIFGALIEAAVTAGVVKYLHKVKPDLVEPLFAERPIPKDTDTA